MTNQDNERDLDMQAGQGTDEEFIGDQVLSADPTAAGVGTRQYPDAGLGVPGLDDSQPTPSTSDQVPGRMALGSESDDDLTGSAYDPADDLAGSPAARGMGTWDDSASTNSAKATAGHAADKAGDVAESAAAKAGEVKDVALERGADVAAVAKDEIARLAHEARAEVQSLWSNASDQLRGQAATGQQQLSELLHSLAGELGEMASKSQNTGPLTALARQAAAKGGEWSHWLQESEPADVLNELRRFARRRPFVFLASAAVAGVVVGRLGRGLMAANDTEDHTPARLTGSTGGTATRAASLPVTGVDTSALPLGSEGGPAYGSGGTYDTEPIATPDNPYGVEGGLR